MSNPTATPRSFEGRWWEFTSDRNLHCADNHSIPNTFRVTESGFIRCSHWDGRVKTECGNWVFVYVFRGGSAIAAEVTLKEQREMERMTSPAEMFGFLGIFPKSADPPRNRT